ncbi:MAG: hypothetical protein QM756_18665 [Polyangiaceae bacterium]
MNGVGKKRERASLDAFVAEAGRLSVAPEKLVFLEAPSSLRGKRDELVRDW